MKGLSVQHLEAARHDLHRLTPGYYLPQTDALEALETGVGNCFAKAMIACGVVAVRYNIEPSVVYSERLHGTKRRSGKPVDPRTKKNMAHIAMVVPGTEAENIPALHFGVQLTKGISQMREEDEGNILEDYNSVDEQWLTVRDDGIVITTDHGKEVGLAAGDWRQLGQEYLSKIDRPALDFGRLMQGLDKKGIHPNQEAA